MSDASIEELEAQVLAATERWNLLARSDHHKDRDCHFYIQRTWSYGEPPYWEVQHYGYLADNELEMRAATYGEALSILLQYIEQEHASLEACLEGRDE